MRSIVLIAHNIRSSHNVGSLLRTAEGLGVTTVYLTGYTPYPRSDNDKRLPHLAAKVHNQIRKTALGAETLQDWKHDDNITALITRLKKEGYSICALEQTEKSLPLPDFKPTGPLALIVGREVSGIEAEVLADCHIILEIPMAGKKESFNVAAAAAIALYDITYNKKLVL